MILAKPFCVQIPGPTFTSVHVEFARLSMYKATPCRASHWPRVSTELPLNPPASFTDDRWQVSNTAVWAAFFPRFSWEFNISPPKFAQTCQSFGHVGVESPSFETRALAVRATNRDSYAARSPGEPASFVLGAMFLVVRDRFVAQTKKIDPI